MEENNFTRKCCDFSSKRGEQYTSAYCKFSGGRPVMLYGRDRGWLYRKYVQTCVFKTYSRPTQKREKRERREGGRGGEREREKKYANQAIFGPVGVHSRNPIDSLQNARVPILKSPPWDLVTSLQSAWPWKFPF